MHGDGQSWPFRCSIFEVRNRIKLLLWHVAYEFWSRYYATGEWQRDEALGKLEWCPPTPHPVNTVVVMLKL